MKNIADKKGIITLILLGLCQTFCAQNQWIFPMAFTDGTGASDTVWFIQDESVVDNGLIMSPYTIIDPNNISFQVYLRKSGDTLWKSMAHPFTIDFISVGIYAENYEFPITVSWNESMFDTIIGDYMPINNARLENAYSLEHDLQGNLLYDWYGWDILGMNTTGPQPPYDENDEQNWNIFNAMFAHVFFPMSVTLQRHYTDIVEYHGVKLNVYPNPAAGTLAVSLYSNQQQFVKISIFDIYGKRIKNLYQGLVSSNKRIMFFNISDLSEGCYFLHYSWNNEVGCIRFIKTN